jgi:mRNA-degrading endonuclease YafQ of YafQ-DinJ toxin-antitoxin module
VTFTLYTTSKFERRLRRFLRKHPQLRERVQSILQDLEHDPFQPHLHLHALHGGLQGYHAVRDDYSNRIVLLLRTEEREIQLLAIGCHDEAYR